MMGAARRLLLAAAVLGAFLFAPVSYAENEVKWDCTPAEGGAVHPGESIIYRMTVQEAGASEGWAILTIRLGEGMRMDKFTYIGAEKLSHTDEDTTDEDTADSDAAADENAAAVEREVIPGNDGCVVLTSILYPGDTAVFSATPETDDAAATVTAYTDAFTSTIEHSVLPHPTAAPAPTPVPVMAMPVATPAPPIAEPVQVSGLVRGVAGVIIFGGLLFITCQKLKFDNRHIKKSG